VTSTTQLGCGRGIASSTGSALTRSECFSLSAASGITVPADTIADKSSPESLVEQFLYD
jgi:hypothetical protein